MGCDIHMFLEYRCGNGMPWQADDHHVPTWESRCKDDEPDNKEKWCDHCLNDGDQQIYCDSGYLDFRQIDATTRDYGLFGLLANVRSSGPRDPRGLPEDVSDMIKAAADKWDSDGHSHSFMTLEEFKNVLLEEAKYPVSTSDVAFYEWEDFERGKYPPSFTSIINYAEKLKQEKSIDKHLLGEGTTSEVQVRVVFWFDN
jgi:hypothetical protein